KIRITGKKGTSTTGNPLDIASLVNSITNADGSKGDINNVTSPDLDQVDWNKGGTYTVTLNYFDPSTLETATTTVTVTVEDNSASTSTSTSSSLSNSVSKSDSITSDSTSKSASTSGSTSTSVSGSKSVSQSISAS
ncbi:hypothetical protein MU545_19725, partial [Enterococcus faecium]|nr:hypothetical protein [Enterococcus faecium]